MDEAGEVATMERAVALGSTAMRRSAPNPWVGCVVVNEGVLVGEGASGAPGGPHAEIEALRAAGQRARGATAIVTLEPCSHHGRTPPCADALAEAGVRRVVAALEDPDPRVRGRGFARLHDAGVEVVVGPGARAAASSLAPYLHHRRTGRAFCHVKLATGVDGRVAPGDGSPQWITGARARADAHELRAVSQAIVVGAGTALVDRPSLTVRDASPPERPPLRVVLDARGRVPATGSLFDAELAPTLVCTTGAVSTEAVDAWSNAGAEVVLLPPASGGVDPTAVFAELGERGILRAMVEGGPTLVDALLDADLVDRLSLYLAPVVLGEQAISAFRSPTSFEFVATSRLGPDLRLDLERIGGAEPQEGS